MKFFPIFLFAAMTGAAVGDKENKGSDNRPELQEQQANSNGRSVAKIVLSDEAEVEFLEDYETGVLIMTTVHPSDDETLAVVLKDATEQANGDPSKLFSMLAGDLEKIPPGLQKKWESMQEARRNPTPRPEGAPPEDTPMAEDGPPPKLKENAPSRPPPENSNFGGGRNLRRLRQLGMSGPIIIADFLVWPSTDLDANVSKM